MANVLGFGESLGENARHASKLFDHLVVILHGALNDELWIVHFPFPFRADWICVMAPTKDTFVRAGQRRGGLYAPMRLDAVEGVLVAATAAAKHGLCPATNLDPGMASYNLVALLGQGFAKSRIYHLPNFACFFFDRKLGANILQVLHSIVTFRLFIARFVVDFRWQGS